MDHKTMAIKLKNNTIKDEELLLCLRSRDLNIILQTIYKVIERKYYDESIVELLTKMAKLLVGYKVAGPYQIGHLAISALYLTQNRNSLKKYEELYNTLNDNDKFLVDNFIKGMENKD